MIGKAKAISHGINNLKYIMGESKNKKNQEKINYICSQHLPVGLDAMGVWEAMQITTAGHPKLKNSMVQFELSPSKEATAHFSPNDWEKLWTEFQEEFDRLVLTDKDGKVVSPRTNLAGSKGIVYLHEESKGGVPHLHAAVCRIDENGHVNNDHDIHLRAQRAAAAVAKRREWATAMDVRETNISHISSICENVLKTMPVWSWDDYVRRIETIKGENLKVKVRKNKQGRVVGYSIIKGDAKYKASELGKGRNLSYSKLAITWRKLHPVVIARPVAKPMENSHVSKPATKPIQTNKPSERGISSTQYRTEQAKEPEQSRTSVFDYTTPAPDRRSVEVNANGENYHLFLPKRVLDFFDDEFDYRFVANWQPLTNLACAYFAAILGADVQVPSGGGGPTNDSGWGRKKDEDDIDFAKRCAQMAKSRIGVTRKNGRGRH